MSSKKQQKKNNSKSNKATPTTTPTPASVSKSHTSAQINHIGCIGKVIWTNFDKLKANIVSFYLKSVEHLEIISIVIYEHNVPL